MSQFLAPRVSRVAVGMAVLDAFAAVPLAAQAADTTATGTLSAASLSGAAPVSVPFSATPTGGNQTVNTTVGGWSVTDATGSVHSYTVNVSAGAPTINGTSVAGSMGSTWLTLTPTQAIPAAKHPAPSTTTPVPATAQALEATAATIDGAAADAPVEYPIPWKGQPTPGRYHVLGVIYPQGTAAVNFNQAVEFTAANATQLKHATPPSAQPATSSLPGWVWVVLAAGAGVLITLSVAVWKLARRPGRVVA